MAVFSSMNEPRPESANSRAAWGLDGDDAEVPAFDRQKSTGIDLQGGSPGMVTSHQALGINDSWLNKFGRGVRCKRFTVTITATVPSFYYRFVAIIFNNRRTTQLTLQLLYSS